MQDVNRFEDVLPGCFTRVRMSEARVRIDAPDWDAFFVALAAIFFGGGLVFLPLALVFAWSVKVGMMLTLAGLLTARVRVRVSRGEARVVRSVLFVPWSVRTTCSAQDVFLSDSETRLFVGDDEWPSSVLWLGQAHREELRVVLRACQSLLA